MQQSLRKFLSINLVIGVSLISLAMTLANYYYAYKDISKHLDGQLVQSARLIDSLISQDVVYEKLDRVQKNLTENTHLAHGVHAPHYLIQFLVWNKQGKLVLKTPHAPNIKFTIAPLGFGSMMIDGQQWRTYSSYNSHQQTYILTTERFTQRNELQNDIAINGLFPLIIGILLLSLFIWSVISKAFLPLQNIADNVAVREPKQLSPIPMTEDIPTEIAPMVNALNDLFVRLNQEFIRNKRFSADAAHELRTPLAALKVHAHIAADSTEESKKQQAIKKLLQGADRCTHIVKQLLTLSRLDPNAILNDSRKVNLSLIIIEVISELAPDAIAKDIQIELDTTEQAKYIIGDATTLSILARNLIDNAIRYTPREGQVTVILDDVEQKILLKIKDNGPGIPPKMRERVFERFFRIFGSKASGSGLGLSIVQQIAELHKAELTLSDPKKGTGLVVTVLFPKAD